MLDTGLRAMPSPEDFLAACVVGGFDLDGGMGDVVVVAQEVAGLVEHGVRVGAGPYLEVDAHGVHAGGDGPHVQVVGLDDSVDLLAGRG